MNLFRAAEYQRYAEATSKEPLTYYDMNLSAQDHQTFFSCECDVSKPEYESTYLYLYESYHHHHHHHHFWPAPVRVHIATRSLQPPERAILSHIDCFSQCEIMGLKVMLLLTTVLCINATVLKW